MVARLLACSVTLHFPGTNVLEPPFPRLQSECPDTHLAGQLLGFKMTMCVNSVTSR